MGTPHKRHPLPPDIASLTHLLQLTHRVVVWGSSPGNRSGPGAWHRILHSAMPARAGPPKECRAMDDLQDDTGKSHRWITLIASALSITSVITAVWLFKGIDWNAPEKSSAAISATVTTLAFIWLVAGFFQQRLELKQNTTALILQYKELRNQVEETKHLVEANRQTAEAAVKQAATSEKLLIAETDKLAFQRESTLRNSDPRFVFDTVLHYTIGRVDLKFINHGGPASSLVAQPVNVDNEVAIQPAFIDSNQSGKITIIPEDRSEFVPKGTMFMIEGMTSRQKQFERVYVFDSPQVGFTEYTGELPGH